MKLEPTSERLEAPVLIAVKIPLSAAVKFPETACTVAIASIAEFSENHESQLKNLFGCILKLYHSSLARK